MSAKRWVLIWILFIFNIPMIGIINYIIDPYNIFETNSLYKYKTDKDRLINSIKLKYNQYETVIIGTSRTQIAIDTRNPILQGKVFNASMPGSNVFEIEKVFNFIIDNQNSTNTIIYGIDFLTFNDKRFLGKQFYDSLYNPDFENKEYIALLKVLISSDTLYDSFNNIKNNMNKIPSNYHNGYFDKNNKKINYKKAFKNILTNNFLVNPETYGCYNYSEHRLKLFNKMLEVSIKKNISLKLFFSPLHYRQLIALQQLGLLEIYFQWMADISNLVNIANKKNNANLISLYDFSGINDITTEKVMFSRKSHMKYYWESSHYTSTTGDLIIKRIFDKNNFGNQLNDVNVNEYMSRYKRHIFDYFEKNGDSISEIEQLYIKTIPIRKQNCSKFKKVQTKIQ